MAHCRDLTAHCGDAIGMLNFYRRFIPRATHLLKPLTDALKGKSQNQLQRDEGSLHQQQGGPLQRGNPSTSRPDSRNVPIAVDASDSHLGAVLQQQARGAALSHSVSSQRSYRSCTTEILWFPQRAILHGVLSGSEAFPPPPGRAEVLYRDGSQTSHFRPTQRFRTMVSQPNKRAVIPCRESS